MIIPAGDAPVALVTGAASGVGAETAARLAAAGWFVAGLDRTASAADLAVEADVSDPRSVREAVARVTRQTARLDACVSCAGVFAREPSPAHLVDGDAWDGVVAVNLTGAFLVARECLPFLCGSGGGVVFVASAAPRMPTPGSGAYVASKAGVLGLMRSLALEYGRFGVRVNAVSPGWIDTPMAAPVLANDDLRNAVLRRIPLGRVASPADIAAIVEFLLSHEARAITGTEIVADGGLGLTANVSDGGLDRFWDRVEAGAHGSLGARA